MSANESPKVQPKRAGSSAAKAGKAQPPDKYSSDYDFLLINRDIEDPLFADVVDCVTKNQQSDNLVYIIVTYGGQGNVAYRVARFLQTIYTGDLVAFVPSLCKSAGTLIVTAADRLVMSPVGEIGPLDVQQIKRDEIWGRRSGLTTRSALNDLKTHAFELFEQFMMEIIRHSRGAISFRLAAQIAEKVAGDLMAPIYQQINPEALGQDFRDLNIATDYGQRLSKHSRNLKPGGLRRLVYDYPSHDFVIDLEEATEIFERVELPTPALINLINGRFRDVMMPRSGAGLVEMLQAAKPDAKKSVAESHSEDAQKSEDVPGDRNQTQRAGNGGRPPAQA